MENRASRRQIVLAWAALAAWTGIIFFLAGGEFSASNTRGWLRELVFRFFPNLTDAHLDAANVYVRKSAHLGVYAILGGLALRALWLSGWALRLRTALLALALSVAVASLDETFQGMRPNRTGSARDVAIDLAGASVGALVISRWLHRRRDSLPPD